MGFDGITNSEFAETLLYRELAEQQSRASKQKQQTGFGEG